MPKMAKKIRDCSCQECVHACERTPGWFAPGEAEKAAELLGIPFMDFKQDFLIRDYWIGEPQIYVLAPRKLNVDEHLDTASWGSAFTHADCVFLKEGKCAIHEAKPYECRHALICEKSPGTREKIVEMWREKGNPLAGPEGS